MPPHRWYPTLGREVHEGLSISVLQGQNTRRHEEHAVALSAHRGKGAAELARCSHLERVHGQSQDPCRLLQLLQHQHIGSVGRVVENREAGSVRATSFKSSNRFPLNSELMLVSPV